MTEFIISLKAGISKIVRKRFTTGATSVSKFDAVFFQVFDVARGGENQFKDLCFVEF